MQVQCAWCGCDLGHKQPLDLTGVTHGICPRCMEATLREAGVDRAGGRYGDRHGAVRTPHARRSYSLSRGGAAPELLPVG